MLEDTNNIMNMALTHEEKVMSEEMNNSRAPAMPTVYMDNTQGKGELYCDERGLTKREHFAALAMQGFCANPSLNDSDSDMTADCAVKFADALLKRLDK